MAPLGSLTSAELSAANAFASAADTYCAAIDKHSDTRPAAFLRTVQNELASLYIAALNLPHVEPASEELPKEIISPEEEAALCRALNDRLGQWQLYWLVFDPFTSPPEKPVASTLGDDLSEIYADVRYARAAWSATDGAAQRDALWQMHSDFETHWGRHATAAMVAIHHLLCDRYVEALEDA